MRQPVSEGWLDLPTELARRLDGIKQSRGFGSGNRDTRTADFERIRFWRAGFSGRPNLADAKFDFATARALPCSGERENALQFLSSECGFGRRLDLIARAVEIRGGPFDLPRVGDERGMVVSRAQCDGE